MSYKDMTLNSSIISVIDEELREEDSAITLTIRVLNDSKWKKMIFQILECSHENEVFGASIKQEYYLNEDAKPAFVWNMVLWGDLEAAEEALQPVLSKRGAPPPPPKSLGVSAPVYRRKETIHKNTDGSVVTTVALPFKTKAATNKEEIIKVRDSAKKQGRPRAYVEGLKS